MFCKLNRYLEIEKKKTLRSMHLCKNYYRSHKKLLEEKIKFSENPDFKSEKKYVCPKIVQRTIPESTNAKQIFY